MNVTIMLPDVRNRPFFQPFSPTDWVLVTAPWTILVLSTRLLMKRPKEPSTRYLLMPIGVYAFFLFATARDWSGGNLQTNSYNYAIGLFSFAGAMKLVEVTFLRQTPRRIVNSITPLSSDSEPESSNLDDAVPAEGHTPRTDLKDVPTTGKWREVLAYLGDPRGLQHDLGLQTPRIHNSQAGLDKQIYLRKRLTSSIFHILLFDLLQTFGQSVPGTTMGTPQGGSIYIPSLPLPWRYIVSSLSVWNMGAGIYSGIQAGYELFTLVSVGLFGTNPVDHPPVFCEPWLGTSVRELWSKRWHAVFKSYFHAIGWTVGYGLLGTFGGVLGVFTLSGILHDVTIWGMGQGTDPIRIVGFFYLQGVAVILEGIWRQVTGRKVRGEWGRLWTWIYLTITAHLVVEAWMQKGLGGGAYFMADKHRPFLLLRNWIRDNLR